MLQPRLEALQEERKIILRETERLIEDGENAGSFPGALERAATKAAFDRVKQIDATVEAGGAPPPAKNVADVLGRLAHVHYIGRTRGFGMSRSDFVRQTFRDPLFSLRVRAAVAPALTSTPTWAGALNAQTVAEVIDLLRPAILLGALFPGEIPILPAGVESIRLPRRGAGSLSGGWVGESLPIPAKATTFSGVTLTPKKVAALTAASNEMMARSEFGAFIGQAMIDDLRTTIDSAIGDAAAASAVRPAGLFNASNSTAVAPTGGANEAAAMTDFANLFAAATSAGAKPATSIWLVNATSFAKLVAFAGFSTSVAAGKVLTIPLFPHPAVAAQTLALVDTAALQGLADDSLGVETSGSASLVLDDAPTAPANLTSMFQTDMTSVKTVIGITWASTQIKAVHVVAPVSWG